MFSIKSAIGTIDRSSDVVAFDDDASRVCSARPCRDRRAAPSPTTTRLASPRRARVAIDARRAVADDDAKHVAM